MCMAASATRPDPSTAGWGVKAVNRARAERLRGRGNKQTQRDHNAVTAPDSRPAGVILGRGLVLDDHKLVMDTVVRGVFKKADLAQ